MRLHRRFLNEKAAPARFVRHYEDAAPLIDGKAKLPPLEGYANVRAIADEMLAQKQIGAIPGTEAPAFAPGERRPAMGGYP